MEYVPNRIYESFTSDYVTRVHYAMRKDGQWFVRLQAFGRFGRQFTPWRKTTFVPEHWKLQEKKARLPKD